MHEPVLCDVDPTLTADEINAAYAWVEWPQREPWRLEAVSRSCEWFSARTADGTLVGLARLLDDGGLHASIWDVIVHPDYQRRGIGTRLVALALERAADRRLVAIVTTPTAAAFFERIGFVAESHGHRAMYLRPYTSPHEH